MKKLSILLSMLMIVGMFGTVASAAGTTSAKVTLDVDKTTVTVGDIVTVTVGLEGDPTLPANGTLKACATWDATYFEYVAESEEATSATFGLTNDATASLASGGTYVTFTQKLTTDENKNIVLDGEYVFGTFQLKAIKATDTTAAISFASATAVKFGATAADSAFADESATVAVTIKAASTKTEVDAVPTNDAGYTDTANNTAYAFYATLGEDASNKTFRWYATIGGEAKKYKTSFTTSDISGEGGVKYGLIYKGTKTITDAKLIEE